jgi:mRNA interferase RelE/StbE
LAYSIQYDPKAVKQLSKLDKSVANVILTKIEEFCSEPSKSQIKKLKTPFDGAYRLRAGDYRVIFYVEDDLMLISRVAHRKSVYED